jgi:hypothetical protein
MVPLKNRAALGKIEMNMSELRGSSARTQPWPIALRSAAIVKRIRGMLRGNSTKTLQAGGGSLGAFLVKTESWHRSHLKYFGAWKWAGRAKSKSRSQAGKIGSSSQRRSGSGF